MKKSLLGDNEMENHHQMSMLWGLKVERKQVKLRVD